MKIIAEKCKKSFIWWTIGLIVSLAIVITLAPPIFSKHDNVVMILAFIVFVICSIDCVYTIIRELRRPDILVYQLNDSIYFYYKGRMIQKNISDIVTVDFFNSQSGRTILKEGTLIIETQSKKYSIYNVKDVKHVALSITAVIHEYSEDSQQLKLRSTNENYSE